MRAVRVRPVLVAAIALFAVLEGVAMALYPGGTWWEPAAHGHRFWQNFLCDLTWRVALNGQDNRVGAVFAQAAMLVLVGGLASFWWLVGRQVRLVRPLGLVSVAATVGVTLMPSERFGAVHGATVMVAAVSGLTAAVLAAVGQRRIGRKRAAALGFAVLGAGAVDLVLYTWTYASGGPGPIALPAIQKVALLLLITWMGVVARETPG